MSFVTIVNEIIFQFLLPRACVRVPARNTSYTQGGSEEGLKKRCLYSMGRRRGSPHGAGQQGLEGSGRQNAERGLQLRGRPASRGGGHCRARLAGREIHPGSPSSRPPTFPSASHGLDPAGRKPEEKGAVPVSRAGERGAASGRQMKSLQLKFRGKLLNCVPSSCN